MPSSLPLLLTPWPLAPGAGARGLIEGLRQAIQSGTLAQGVRLPTSRELAAQTGLGRNIVTAAYAGLVAEGWIEGRGRHGTFVRGRPHPESGSGLQLAARLSATSAAEIEPHADWRLGQAGTLSLPLDSWRQACREVGRDLPPAGYGDPRGDPPLRQAISAWLSRHRGLRVEPRQIIITQGAAQGIAQLAELLLQPGDRCAVESPGYPQAANIFRRRGAALDFVAVDEEGMDINAAFAGPAPALLHLTPAHHYPLGVRLSGARRLLLLELARRHGTLVLENEYDHEFVRSGPRHAPLLAAAPEQTVLVSTFAKAISPALRLGYLVAAPGLVDRLAEATETAHAQTSWPAQRAMAWLLRSGELERHLKRVRRRDEHLRDHLLQRSTRWAPRLRITGTAGGQHVLLSLPTPAASRALYRQLTLLGVRAEPLEHFAPASPLWHGLFMSYGQMSMPTLQAAMDLLDRAMERMG
jgi:GntR family transcriptional regulator / MocR family aminotransferase